MCVEINMHRSRNVTCFNRESSCASQRVSEREGYTPAGGVAILANMLANIGDVLQDVEAELMQEASAWVVNGHLVTGITSLQNVLDAMARFCQHQQPLHKFENGLVYFHSYEFRTSDFIDSIGPLQRAIECTVFDDLSFNDLANRVKHEAPWLGLVTTGEASDVNDIYDAHGRRALYDVAVPVYKKATAICKRLAVIFNCQTPTFPIV